MHVHSQRQPFVNGPICPTTGGSAATLPPLAVGAHGLLDFLRG